MPPRDHSSLIFAGLTMLLSCAPATSTSRILQANAVIQTAESANADKYAPYELTRAREYLHKAREEQGYSDFEIAAKYAALALEFGEKARAKAQGHPSSAGEPRDTPANNGPATQPAGPPK